MNVAGKADLSRFRNIEHYCKTLNQLLQAVRALDRPLLDRRWIDALPTHSFREFIDVRPVEFGDVRRVPRRHFGSQGLEDEASATAVRERVAKAVSETPACLPSRKPRRRFACSRR
jgi:hypothetical protein